MNAQEDAVLGNVPGENLSFSLFRPSQAATDGPIQTVIMDETSAEDIQRRSLR